MDPVSGDFWDLGAWIARGGVVFLTVLNGVLLLAENATINLMPADLHAIGRRRPRSAQRLSVMRRNRFLLWVSVRTTSALLLFIPFCLAATVVGDSMALLVGTRYGGVLVAMGMLAVLYTVFARMLPRKFASTHSRQAARRLERLLYVQYVLMMPLSRIYERMLSPEEHQAWREPAAGDVAVIEAVQQAPAGAIDATDVKMITNVIELGDRTVRQVMTPRPDIIAVSADTPLHQALHTANTHGLSRLPVYADSFDSVLGVLHVRDGVASLLDDAPPPPLRTLARPPLVVPDSKFVDRLLREMQAANIHLAIVVNEYGDTAGLVTIEDLLEEIVGEIEDEYDTADTPIEQVGPGQARVAASLPIDTLNAELDLALSVDDMHTTVGGLAFSAFGRIPDIGESVTVDGVRLRVLALRDTRITRLEVTRLDPADA